MLTTIDMPHGAPGKEYAESFRVLIMDDVLYGDEARYERALTLEVDGLLREIKHDIYRAFRKAREAGPS